MAENPKQVSPIKFVVLIAVGVALGMTIFCSGYLFVSDRYYKNEEAQNSR